MSPSRGDKVTGTVEPGATATVATPEGVVLCTVPTTAKGPHAGEFTCTLTPAVADGTDLEVTASDAAGNVSEPAQLRTDSQSPEAPVVNPPRGETITGEAEAGSHVVVKDAGGKVLGTYDVGEDGTWSVTPKRPLTPGEVVSATATDAAGNVSDPGTGVVLGAVDHPGLTLTVGVVAKDSDGRTVEALGSVNDTVRISFTVTNTGDQPVSGLKIASAFPMGHADGLTDIACPAWKVEAGRAITCTATYDVTQVDIDNGHVAVEAVATGKARHANGVEVAAVTSNTASGQVAVGGVTAAARLTVSARVTRTEGGETVTIGHADHAGDLVTYVYTVLNTGGVTLGDPRIADALPGLADVDCPDETVAPGQTLSCTASYSVTWHDVEAGLVVNTATATLATAAGDRVDAGESTVVVPTGDAFELLGHERTSDLEKRDTGSPNGDNHGTGAVGTETGGTGTGTTGTGTTGTGTTGTGTTGTGTTGTGTTGTGGTGDGVLGAPRTTPAPGAGTGRAAGSSVTDPAGRSDAGRSGQGTVRTSGAHGPSFGTGGTAVGGGSVPSPAPAGNGPAVLVAVLTRSPRGLRRWQVR